ncbi:AraC family transcriptional regulator [Bradyrhizobium sp. STM 3557]|uniref:AraC family transcriptional regulator n=1 Tax=Bradyrhizobium sp. STM 3557 TaxID=578920 RepID=UPI00388DFE09
MTDTHSKPLHRYRAIWTSDSEELRQLGLQWLGASRIDLRNIGNFEARLNAIELDTIGLAFGATSCDLTADQYPMDVVRLQIALKGRGLSCVGRRITDIDDRQFAITPAGVPWQMVCQGGHERLTMRLQQAALSQKLASLIGVQPKGDYRFEHTIPANDPQARSLFQLVNFLAQQLDDHAATMPRAVYRELEDAVLVAFLSASRHKYRELLDTPGLMPELSLVKRLEDFIEASWREAITIDRLVAEAGVSARSLFRAFARVRGYSPIAFAKSVRLRRAREMLLSGDPAMTVATAAAACNFANPGHFARYYRETFGELPSATVMRGAR